MTDMYYFKGFHTVFEYLITLFGTMQAEQSIHCKL